MQVAVLPETLASAKYGPAIAGKAQYTVPLSGAELSRVTGLPKRRYAGLDLATANDGKALTGRTGLSSGHLSKNGAARV